LCSWLVTAGRPSAEPSCRPTASEQLQEAPHGPAHFAGTLSRLDGRVAIFEYLRNYPKIIDVHEIDSLEIYPTDRSDTVIGEWSVKGHVIPNGNAYNMAYATFVTVRDGSIVNYRPLAGLPSGARWNGSFVSPSAPRTPPAEMARTGRRRQRHERGAWRWHRRRRRRRGRPWCPACSCPRAAVAGSEPDVRGACQLTWLN
jgi:hypothetical protein